LDNIEPTEEKKFANFFPERDGLTKRQIFINHVIDVLIYDLPMGLQSSCRHAQGHKIARLIIHVWSCMINLVTYFLVCVFPLVLITLMSRTIYELITQDCVVWMTWL